MKAVGVKVLKARLSEYLRLVKSGETILVTERDDVVAEIRPANRQNVAPDSAEEALNRLAEDGQVTLRSNTKKGWGEISIENPVPRLSSMDILQDLRRDR